MSHIDFAAVVDSAPDAVVIVNTETGEIRFVNARFVTLFGYRPEEVVGRPVETLIPDRFRTTHVVHRQGYARFPITRAMGTGLELAARRQDGSEFPVEISLSTLATPDGPLTIAFVRDVSERRRADVTARDLNREVAGLRDALENLGSGVPPRRFVWLIVALLVVQIATQIATAL